MKTTPKQGVSKFDADSKNGETIQEMFKAIAKFKKINSSTNHANTKNPVQQPCA